MYFHQLRVVRVGFSITFKDGGESAEIDGEGSCWYFSFYLHGTKFILSSWLNLLAVSSSWKPWRVDTWFSGLNYSFNSTECSQ
mgnify:CR=1 FL=1